MIGARLLLVGAVLLAASPARAQTGSDVTTAQALFEEGRRLMRENHYDEACPKLVESQRLDPGGGTLLAIALCHEGQGKLATAWGDFNLAASEARRDHRADREAAALDKVRALQPRLSRARIVVTSAVDGLEIARDGKTVGAAEWGTPLPIDGGDHTFEARAPGKKGWRATVSVVGEGKTIDVPIPPLAEETPAPPPAAPVVASVPPPVVAPPAAPPPVAAPPLAPAHDGSSTRAVGFVMGGVSLALVGVGLGFGASALSKWHDADAGCNGGTVCTNPNAAAGSASAGRAADVSTVLVTVGGVGLAGSVAVILLAPSGHGSSAGLRLSPMIGGANGLVLGGAL